MDKSSWETIDAIVGWLDEESPLMGDPAVMMRVLKIGEEYGEVAEALHGVLGGNPRKGDSHDWEDVQKELVDVVVTALVALRSVTPDAQKVFDARVRELGERTRGVHARVADQG